MSNTVTTYSTTWKVTWQPPVTYKDVVKLRRKNIGSQWHERLRLKLKPYQYSVDGKWLIPYKDMGNKRYVFVKKVKPAPSTQAKGGKNERR